MMNTWMGRWILTLGWILGGMAQGEDPMKTIYDFTMTDIDGEAVALSEYKGKVLLMVNVASKCGFTGQYAGLEKLYETYATNGLVVLGFPANNFFRQEPGTDAEIKSFCRLTYGVSFPLFAKISVKGKDIDPLYAFLTDKNTNPKHSGGISWNFNKFLIGRDGSIRNRFGSRTAPDNKKLAAALEEALQSPE
jgi:glutathione peroxidase-family protein